MSSDEVSLAIEVDADDAISSLEEYVKMLEEVEKASDIDLDGITDALEGAGEGADSAIKPMEGLTDAFDNVVSTADGASSSLESIAASFESGTSASEGLVSAVTEAGSGFEEFSGSAEAGTGSLEALVASFEEGTAASETLNSGMTELPGVIDETASASTGLSAELENTGSLFTETSASATETAGALTDTNAAFTETATAATDTGTALTEMTTTTVDLGASVAELAPAVTDASTGFTDLTTATTDTATGMVDIATETTNVATEMTSLGPAVTEGASAFKTLETNMGASVGFFGQAASGAIGLVRQFTSLNNLQTRVAFTENRLSTFRENLGKATEKLTKLQASGTASAKDLAAAQLDVEQAEQKVDIQTQRVEQSQESLNIAMADFYLTIGPNIIQTATGIVAGISQVPRAIGNLSGLFSRLTGSVAGTTGSVDQYNATVDQSIVTNDSFGQSLEETDISGFGNDLGTTAGGFLNLSRGTTLATQEQGKFQGATQGAQKETLGLGRTIGVVAAVIATASVAIGLIANNTFGARDALNAFGEAIGNAIPPLEGILVGIQNLAVDIGIAGDDAKAQATNFDTLTESVVKMGQGMQDTGAKMAESGSAMEQRAGGAVEKLGSTVETTGPKIIDNVDSWGEAFGKFGDALGRQDWGTALDLLGQGFLSVGQFAVDSAKIIGDAYNVGQQTWLGTLQDFGFNAGNLLIEAAKQGAAGFVDSITRGVAGLELLIFGAGGFDKFVQLVMNVAQDAGDALNSTYTFVEDISDDVFTALGLPNLVEDAKTLAGQIGAELAKIKLPVLGPIGTPQPTAVPEPGKAPGEQPTGGFAASSAAIIAQQTQANKNTAAWKAMEEQFKRTEAPLQSSTQMFGSLTTAQAATTLGSAKLSQSVSKSRPFISEVTASTGRLIDTTGQLGIENNRLSDTTKHLNNNFLAAMNTNQGFREAFVAAGGEVANLSGQWIGYAAGLQSANDTGVRINDTVLKSIPATSAFGEEIGKTAEQRQMDLGVASAWLTENAKEIDQRKLTGAEIIATAENMKKEQEVMEQERAARDSLTAGLKEEMADRLKVTQANHDTVASYTSSAFAASQSAEANAAIAETFDPLIEGQRVANEQTRGIQQAYEQLNPATLNQIVAYQKEAQALELGNILKDGSNRATIALAQAQTAGVKSGVEFANQQFTAQASLQGYRAALSEAIAGNTEYGDSLGLTTQQLEQALSFQNDVVAAQEAIINVGAEVVHSQTVQAEAWRTMSQEQLNNLNIVNQARAALISLNNPLADNAANVQAVNEAFLAGGEAANAFVLGLRTSSAEAAGYKKRLNELIPAQQQVGDTAGYTTEQMERLASSFSGTSESLRQMTGSMLEASSNFIGMLEFDPEELHTKIDDAFKEVPDWIRDTMSRELQGGIVAQGDIERVGKQLVDNTGAAIVGAWRTNDPFKHIADFASESIDEVFGELDPQVAAALEPVRKQFEELAKMEGFSAENTQHVQALGQTFTRLAVEAEKAVDPFSSLYEEMDKVGGITPQMAANVATLDGGLKSLSEQGVGASLGLAEVGTKATEGQVPMVELKNAAGDVVGQFANVNGELLPVNQGLSALVPASQLAGNALLGVGEFANAVVIRFGDIQEAVALTGTAFSLLTNIIGVGFGNVMAVLGAHVTTLNTYFATTIPVALMATQNAWVLFSTTFINNFAIMIAQAGLHVLTLSTYFTTTIPVALMATQNAWVLFSTTFINNFAIMIEQAGLHVTTLNTYFVTTIPIALTTSQTAFTTFSTTVLTAMATLISGLGAHVTTINTYFTTTIPTALTRSATVFTTSTNAMSTSVLTLRNNVQETAGDVTSSFDEITSSASSMASSATSSMNAVSNAALNLRNNVEQSMGDIEQSLHDAAETASRFASSFASSMSSVVSSANSAASAVKSLQSAINSLKDKTVTITTRYVTTGKPAGAQHGGSFIVDRPMDISGVNVGEHHKPELITVTPLTNPNRNSDRTIDLGRLAGAPTTRGLQKGGSIITAPSSGFDKDMMRELIEEVRDTKDAIRRMKLQPPPLIMDGKRVDEIQQIRRNRRIGDFG